MNRAYMVEGVEREDKHQEIFLEVEGGTWERGPKKVAFW